MTDADVRNVPPRARGGETHWDAVYRERGTEGVSWFQPAPTVSLDLICSVDAGRHSAVLDVGGGASLLADTLLRDGFSDLSILDVSTVALEAQRERLEHRRARLGALASITLIHADLLQWTPERTYGLWHDRAVLHFLVREGDRDLYRRKLRSALRPGGAVVLGVFAPDGPEQCSGLPVARYSDRELGDLLGPDFQVLEHRREEHVTPAGVTQPFTWLAARRVV